MVRTAILLFLATLLGPSGCGDAPDISDPSPADITELPQKELPVDAKSDGDPGPMDDGVPSNVEVISEVDGGPPLGGIGDPCTEDTECASGYCVQTAEGKACSETCTDDCPEGWACEDLLGSNEEVVSICMDPHIKLCSPCTSDDDCLGDGASEQARCVDFGDREGSFCGVDCADEQGLCPNSYVCTDLVDPATGAPLRQCVPVSDSCNCSPWATEIEATTSCGKDFCEGARVCGPEGLTECSAQEAT